MPLTTKLSAVLSHRRWCTLGISHAGQSVQAPRVTMTTGTVRSGSDGLRQEGLRGVRARCVFLRHTDSRGKVWGST
jgi:hypothetical protein